LDFDLGGLECKWGEYEYKYKQKHQYERKEKEG
jgi:hypothetical protein